MTNPSEIVSVRYMVDDVQKAVDFYTKFLSFNILTSFPPAFADVARGNLRLLLSGPGSSAGRPMPDGAKPGPGGWNRIHLIVDDIEAEVARLRDAGASFRNDILSGPGGKQICCKTPPATSSKSFKPARPMRWDALPRDRAKGNIDEPGSPVVRTNTFDSSRFETFGGCGPSSQQ